MASYSNPGSSYQTLRGYKHVWCYQREPVVTSYLENAVCLKVSLQNWYNNSEVFDSIVMLLMLCVFMSRVCWLPKRGPTWLRKSCTWLCTYAYSWASSSCSCVHLSHHGLYRFIWLSFNANNYPFWGKERNQSGTFSKQLSIGFAFTNTDWDSVTWGCSLTVIVGILTYQICGNGMTI